MKKGDAQALKVRDRLCSEEPLLYGTDAIAAERDGLQMHSNTHNQTSASVIDLQPCTAADSRLDVCRYEMRSHVLQQDVVLMRVSDYSWLPASTLVLWTQWTQV